MGSRAHESRSPRTLKSKIHAWKLDKKLKEVDVLTALYILTQHGYGPDNAPQEDITFNIRGRSWPLKKLLTYCRRKNIYDEFEWLQERKSRGFEPAQKDVKILSVSSSVESRLHERSASSSNPSNIAPSNTPFLDSLHKGLEVSTMSLDIHLQPPHSFHVRGKLVWISRLYCSVYMESSSAGSHTEPSRHQDTSHGHFGHEIQNGICAVIRGDPRAWGYFQSAFDILPRIVGDMHPMGIAQVLTVVCELAARVVALKSSSKPTKNTLHGVLALVLNAMAVWTAQMHAQTLVASLFSTLRTITSADEVTSQCVVMLQTMADALGEGEVSQSDTTHWKWLYLKERYCDGLFHTGMHGSRQSARLQLLWQQEQYYRMLARNVLWTLTNVAEDHLYNCNASAAEAAYEDVLVRAEAHRGFARAKIRFAALEGLAKSAELRAKVTKVSRVVCW